jgi:hypothetical protein
MSRPPISAARPNQEVFDQSFNKSLSIVSDDPFRFLSPALEHALELLKSDAVEQLCQTLDHHIRISKSPILQRYLDPCKNPKLPGLKPAE